MIVYWVSCTVLVMHCGKSVNIWRTEMYVVFLRVEFGVIEDQSGVQTLQARSSPHEDFSFVHPCGHVISSITILPEACSQFSPVKRSVQTQRYFLLVYPVKHFPLLRQGVVAQRF